MACTAVLQVTVSDDRDTLQLGLLLSGPFVSSTGPPVERNNLAPNSASAYQVGSPI